MIQVGRLRATRLLAATVAVLLCSSKLATAQFQLPTFEVESSEGGAAPAKSAQVSATLTPDATRPGEATLAITVTLPDGANTYGQDKTAQKKTAIKITEATGAKELGDGYTPDREPQIEYEELFQKDVGKYKGQVTFSRPFQVEPGATIQGTIDFLQCDSQACLPVKLKFSATLADAGSPPAPLPQEASAAIPAPVAAPAATVDPTALTDAPPFTPAGDDPLKWGYRIVPTRRSGGKLVQDPVRVQFVLSPATAKTGEPVTLSITMDLDENWHTYALQPGEKQIEQPTEIALNRTDGLEPEGDWTESPAPEVVQRPDSQSRLFSHRVTWSKTFTRTESPNLAVEGELSYQICEEDKRCLPQKTMPFALGEGQPAELVKDAVAATAVPNEPGRAAATFEVAQNGASTSLPMVLLFAFVGGLTLNIMPCVLPVLAIKILSFVQQAGESRARILSLNLVYTLGVVSVFWLLAGLAAFFSYSWGGLFQQEWFRVGMVLLLFVLGLNMLGVFEVMLPGVIGHAAGMGHREGLPGAFLTGIFATLLATPCSTAYMGYAFAWSLNKPAPLIFLVWTTMGLGMALPYLLVGTFPALIRILPRPGMWMVRFKQFSAFALFGASVFFLKSVDQRNVLPVLTAAVGLSVALWMIGTLYDHATAFNRKSVVRIFALLIGGGICYYAYQMHRDATMVLAHKLDWKKFDSASFEQLRKEGKPILIDFTADWCLICKQNEAGALNTEETVKFVRDNNIIPLMADWTDENDEIREWLNRFGSISVPLTVIVPPDPNAKLTTLSGLYSKKELLSKLEAAMKLAPANGQAAPIQQTAAEATPAASVAAAQE